MCKSTEIPGRGRPGYLASRAHFKVAGASPPWYRRDFTHTRGLKITFQPEIATLAQVAAKRRPGLDPEKKSEA